jgi:hypothetical protein
MKYATILFIFICACSPLHNSAKDPDTQLALKGVSNAFRKLRLTPDSLADKLNAGNWELYIVPSSDLNCNGAQACTHISKQKIVMELPLGGPWKECPRVSQLIYHELYHVALKYYQGFSDPVHIDLRWGLVEALMRLKNPCETIR